LKVACAFHECEEKNEFYEQQQKNFVEGSRSDAWQMVTMLSTEFSLAIFRESVQQPHPVND
jgi:hypothetical protein